MQKTREEISDKYKWDLTKIYNSDADFEKELKEATKEIEEVTKYKNLIESASNLLNYLEYSIKMERKLYKLYYYAHLNFDSDTTNTKYQEMNGKVVNLLSKYDELSSFVTPTLMTLDYDKILEFIKQNPKLKDYEFKLEEIYRYKKHILTKDEEAILSKLNNALNNASLSYEALVDSDMKFGDIKDENGNIVELTESNYKVFIESPNRDIRKQAFNQLLNTYGNFKNTITKMYDGNVESLVAIAKLRKFNSSLYSSLFNENIPKKVYDNLIDTVSDNLNVLYKYFDLCKETLNLDNYHLYDQYVELVPDLDKKYNYETAKQMILESLSVLGEDYIENINKAFNEKWIDVYNNKGKRSGAYSSGFYDINPYILLNYENRINDVSTLAHELGHSMHTYYSCQNNPYQYSSYKIFVAEVASTVNELLLNYYILNNSSDVNEKKYILSNMMKLFKSTIYRQTMFAEFEKLTHEMKENNEVLTYEKLCNLYYDLNKKYFGPNVIVDEAIKYEWERIPHFYYNFYVYKYAIGLSCACYIVKNILNNNIEDYKKFLCSGGSDYPINELLIAGVDATSKEVVESAINLFDDLIEQFKALS